MNLELTELSEEQRQIAEAIGMESYIKLSESFGGTNIYVAKANEIVLRKERDERIRKEFNGYNHTELALKYGLTEKWIRNIVSAIEQEIRAKPLSGQLTIVDCI